jgi:uncharacterized membrane protein
MEANPDAKVDNRIETPSFEAILYPSRSLGKRGYVLLIAGTGLVIGLYGLTFLLIGAWPIFGFLGAEWLLFWFLFSRHFRGDRRAERLRLYADRLVLEALDAKGKLTRIELQPYWLQLVLEHARRPNGALFLRSHGKNHEIGAFLSPGERQDLAFDLAEVLNRHRAKNSGSPSALRSGA